MNPFSPQGGMSPFLVDSIGHNLGLGCPRRSNFFCYGLWTHWDPLGVRPAPKSICTHQAHPLKLLAPKKRLNWPISTSRDGCRLAAPSTFHGRILLPDYEFSLLVSILWSYTHPGPPTWLGWKTQKKSIFWARGTFYLRKGKGCPAPKIDFLFVFRPSHVRDLRWSWGHKMYTSGLNWPSESVIGP